MSLFFQTFKSLARDFLCNFLLGHVVYVKSQRGWFVTGARLLHCIQVLICKVQVLQTTFYVKEVSGTYLKK